MHWWIATTSLYCVGHSTTCLPHSQVSYHGQSVVNIGIRKTVGVILRIRLRCKITPITAWTLLQNIGSELWQIEIDISLFWNNSSKRERIYWFVSSRGFCWIFQWGNSSLISKVESKQLSGALDSCFVLYGTFEQCATTEPWWEPNTQLHSLETNISNRSITDALSRLGILTSPIILHSPTCYHSQLIRSQFLR